MKIRAGMGNIKIEEFAELCGGVVCGNFDTEETVFSYVCTDSREADADTLFIAIPGENVDGHDYMLSAAENGCRCFLCERVPEELVESDLPFAAVTSENTICAFGEFVRAYTEFRSKKTVAVTGSVGKTTTKEFLSAVLSERFCVHKTDANHNSIIGMPMSLLAMEPEQEVMVAEMGMSSSGEISFMSKIARPDIACITNIGTSHLESLGTRENISRAKLEIADGLTKDGLLILNGDEPLLFSTHRAGIRTVYVALENPRADFRAINIRFDERGTFFDICHGDEIIHDFRVNVLGKQYVWAAMFAVATGLELGMDMASIRNGLLHFENAAMRQNICEYHGITIVEDCYNASPESMKAAADLLKILAGKRDGARRVALLGDMRELGENSSAYHKNVGRYFAMTGTGVLFTVGLLAKDIALGAVLAGMAEDTVTICTDPEDRETISDIVAKALKPGDILLVKASRAIGAEKILELIRQKI